MAPTITISPGNADEVVLNPGDIESTQAVKIHSGISDFRASVAYDPTLESLRGSEVHVDDPEADYFFRGSLIRTSDRESAGDAGTEIEGLGVEHDLERNANEHTVTNELIHDAIDSYWSSETSFSATVTDQTADETTTGTQAQEANTTSEFNDIIGGQIDDTDPLEVSGDTVDLLQSSFVFWSHTQDDALDVSTLVTNDDDLTGGMGWGLSDAGNFVDWSFTLDHTIPAGEFDLWVRDETTGGDPPDVVFKLDGQIVTAEPTAVTSTLQWTNYSLDTLDAIQPGTYTIRVEVTAAGADEYRIGTIAPQDGRFSYTFDNTLDANEGHLDGPEEYPDQFEKEFVVAPTTWNVTDATLSTTWNNTTGNQRIQMRLDPDGTWVGATNSTSTTQSFGSDAGTAIRGRARWSRYGTQTNTPKTGINGQSLQSWEITFDGNDIPVYTETTLEGSDAAILQQMHEDARMRFTVTHADGSKNVASYPVGESKATPDWTVINTERVSDLGGEYANAITVRGARDSDGNRIKREVTDSTAISNFGREHWEERRPDASTQVEVDRIARQVLKKHLRESNVTAEREIASIDVMPGYAYEITLQDGSTETVPSEEVHYRYSAGDVTGRVIFNVRATELQERLNSVDSGLTRTQLSF